MCGGGSSLPRKSNNVAVFNNGRRGPMPLCMALCIIEETNCKKK